MSSADLLPAQRKAAECLETVYLCHTSCPVFSCHGLPRTAKSQGRPCFPQPVGGAVLLCREASQDTVSIRPGRIDALTRRLGGEVRGRVCGRNRQHRGKKGRCFGAASSLSWLHRRGGDRRPKNAKSGGKGRGNARRREGFLSASSVNWWVKKSASDGQAPRKSQKSRGYLSCSHISPGRVSEGDNPL